jgi:4-amino-4-deoxy-L-arabinose transferase-like glycosyltransferase
MKLLCRHMKAAARPHAVAMQRLSSHNGWLEQEARLIPHPLPPLTRVWWAALAALPLIVLLLRALGFLPSVMDWDESLYALQAREWMHGGWPLVAAWDMHPIGAPAMFAGAMQVFGQSIFAIRLLGVIAVTTTCWALFACARAAGAGPATGYAAALLYAGHSVVLGGMPVNTELLFAPFTTAAMALAIHAACRPDERPAWWRLCAMGLLVGWALLVKPVAVAEGCLAFALLVAAPWLRGSLSLGRVLGFAAAYALLCALPTLGFGVIYAAMGELDAYLDGTFFAPFRYAQGAAGADAAWRIATAMATLLWPLLLGLAGLVMGRGQPLRSIALVWFLAATLAVAGPAQFFQHYFLIWLPPLSLLAALGAVRIATGLAAARPAPLLALLLALVALDPWRGDTAQRLGRGHALLTPDVPARVAALIAAELPPGEAIFVPNYQPIIYFLAQAGIPTRFPFPVHLTGAFANLAGNSTDGEVGRILATKPRFIVIDRGWWGAMRPAAANAIAAALEAHYELAYVFPEERNMIELWRIRGGDPGE